MVVATATCSKMDRAESDTATGQGDQKKDRPVMRQFGGGSPYFQILRSSRWVVEIQKKLLGKLSGR